MMKPKKERNTASKKKVSFSFYGPKAKEVAVLGDFNQWKPNAHPMKLEPDGFWRKSLFVLPGTYQYKFKVDGQWANDPENAEICENEFGTHNNCLVVGQKKPGKNP